MKILCEKHNSIAKVILNRPEVLNAFDIEMRVELADVLGNLTTDEEVRTVIITGKGRAFCTGGDVRGQGRIKVSTINERLEKAYTCICMLVNMPKPVIAAVNGPALGLGCSLAFAADIIFASEEAKFSLAFSKVGVVPDGGCIYFLTRMLGMPLAKELVFTGRTISAWEAMELGLINRVLPPEELETVVMEMAAQLASGPTKAYGLTKKLFNQSLYVDLETFLKVERYAQFLAVTSDDHYEGVSAFLQKRQPVFKGR